MKKNLLAILTLVLLSGPVTAKTIQSSTGVQLTFRQCVKGETACDSIGEVAHLPQIRDRPIRGLDQLADLVTPPDRNPIRQIAYGDPLWGPFLSVWIIKKLVMKYGGMRMYRKLVPGFLGLALFDQKLQVAVDRAQADPGQAAAHQVVEIRSRGMILQLAEFLQDDLPLTRLTPGNGCFHGPLLNANRN